MRKTLSVLCCLILIAAISGCTSVSVRKFTRDRVDTEVSGNQGVIYGPTPAPHKVESKREFYAVDIELPTMGEVKETLKKKSQQPAQQDKGVWGNAGNVKK